MGLTTSIQWTDATFNPFRGCTKVSPGCANCYAERGSARNPKVLGKWGPGGSRVLASAAQWNAMNRAEDRCAADGSRMLVFCASLADIFEDSPRQMVDSQERPLWAGDGFGVWLDPLGGTRHPYTLRHARARLWNLIRETPHLTYQLLTKRPENIPTMMPAGDWPNVWLGTSVETNEYLWRVDALCEAPQNVPVRFISYEPALGPLHAWDVLRNIQWVIMGGESGGQARECRLTWFRSLIAQCRDAGTAIFVKQVGKDPVDSPAACNSIQLPLVHDPKHGGVLDDWPQDLRIREMPL